MEVPIRVQEVTYENQRWNPIDGFGPNLLPTDRANFSTIDGTIARPKNGVKLPSMAWQWESEWCVEIETECGYDTSVRRIVGNLNRGDLPTTNQCWDVFHQYVEGNMTQSPVWFGIWLG